MTADHPTPADRDEMDAANIIKRELWARLDEVMTPVGSMHQTEVGPTTLGDWLGDRVFAALLEAGALLPPGSIVALADLTAELARRDAALADLTRQRDEAVAAAKSAIDEALALADAQLRVIDQRDEALAELDDWRAVPPAELQSRIEADLRDEVRALKGVNELITQKSNGLQDTLERQAPVIEAARALVSHGPLGILGALDPLAPALWAIERDSRWAAVREALNALGPVDPEATAQPAGRGEETTRTRKQCPTCGPGYRYGDDGCRHTEPSGFGAPGEYVSRAATCSEFCPWCGRCLACNGDKPCKKGTDGLHYWPTRAPLHVEDGNGGDR